MPSRVERALAAALALGGCVGSGSREPLAAVPAIPHDGATIADAGEGPRIAPPPVPDPERYDEVGYASWYGDESAGRRTSAGKPFDPNRITAASRSLPLGSYAEVTALETGRTIVVLITDRGPQRSDRILDLSRGAARLLGTDAQPVAPVRVRQVVLSPQDQNALRAGRPASARGDAPPVLLTVLRRRLPGGGTAVAAARTRGVVPSVPRAQRQPPGFYIQVATFSSQSHAQAVADGLRNGRLEPAGALWRVQLGPYGDAHAAEQARDEVAQRGYGDVRILRIP